MHKSSLSLRERRRRQTERELQLSTLRLIKKHGLESVTAEMIAQAAGVSLRTFFNYFPNKIAAAIGPRNDFTEEALEAFATGKGALLEDLSALLEEHLEAHEMSREAMQITLALARSNPLLEAAFHDSSRPMVAQLSPALLRRMPELSEHDVPLVAQFLLIGMSPALEAWSTSEMSFAEAMVVFRDRLRMLAALFAQELPQTD